MIGFAASVSPASFFSTRELVWRTALCTLFALLTLEFVFGTTLREGCLVRAVDLPFVFAGEAAVERTGTERFEIPFSVDFEPL
jgi:hypothetical protein